MLKAELSPEASELEALLNAKEPAAVLEAILGSTPSGAIIARAPDGIILRVSDYAAQLLGRSRSELEGRTGFPAYDASGRPLPNGERPLIKALRGETVTGFEVWLEGSNGEMIPCVCNAAPIRNCRGELIGAIDSFVDMRPSKALELSLREALAQCGGTVAERETLYRELTHRVKNHLQIMAALVSLGGRGPARSIDDFAKQIKAQLQALGAVYRSMDRAEVGARVEARTFLEDICRLYATDAVNVEAVVVPPDLTLTSDQAAPVGMLVNEAIANSRKHAFPDSCGRIDVSLRRLKPGRLRLEVADDGLGWPLAQDTGRTSHGMELMRMFAKQLHSELELSDRPHGGAMVAAELPEAAG
jgi:PAS domain S-box-containing protein